MKLGTVCTIHAKKVQRHHARHSEKHWARPTPETAPTDKGRMTSAPVLLASGVYRMGPVYARVSFVRFLPDLKKAA